MAETAKLEEAVDKAMQEAGVNDDDKITEKEAQGVLVILVESLGHADKIPSEDIYESVAGSLDEVTRTMTKAKLIAVFQKL